MQSAALAIVNPSVHPSVGPSVRPSVRFLQERCQTRVGSLKSTNLQFSHCYIFSNFRNNVSINCTLRCHTVLVSAGTNKDDLECPIQLKVRFTDGTFDVYVRCGFQNWPCVTEWTWALTVSDKNVAMQWTVISEHVRFVRIFFGDYCRAGDEPSWAAKLGLLFTLCSIISLVSWLGWPFAACIIMKALSGFLMILRQMTLKYIMYESFIDRPRMSDGSLADSVHTTLSSLLYNCTTGAVFSEVYDQWASRKDVLSLCCSWASC